METWEPAVANIAATLASCLSKPVEKVCFDDWSLPDPKISLSIDQKEMAGPKCCHRHWWWPGQARWRDVVDYTDALPPEAKELMNIPSNK